MSRSRGGRCFSRKVGRVWRCTHVELLGAARGARAPVDHRPSLVYPVAEHGGVERSERVASPLSSKTRSLLPPCPVIKSCFTLIKRASVSAVTALISKRLGQGKERPPALDIEERDREKDGAMASTEVAKVTEDKVRTPSRARDLPTGARSALSSSAPSVARARERGEGEGFARLPCGWTARAHD